MITLRAEPTNPAHFYGCCGFFELAGFVQPGVQGWWSPHGFTLTGDDSLFPDTLELITRLRIEPDPDWDGSDSERPFDLRDLQSDFSIRMDWWEARHGRERSRWKCFSGQMSACVITERLLLACREAASAVTPDNLFSWSERLSSRLNYDPRSAWDAGSAGFSPNDHRELQEAVTYPYSEFLSSVALQTYPFDADKAWEATYTAWLEPLPLMVARLAAADRLPGRPSRRFSFAIQKRSQALNYFTFSRED